MGLFKRRGFLLDTANDNGSASGYGTTPPPASTPAKETPPSGNTDDKPVDDAAKEAGAQDPAATGDQSKQATPPEQQKPEETKPLELDLKGLDQTKVQDTLDFAKAHNLSKEAAQALVDRVKAQEDASTVAASQRVENEKKVFEKWENELRADKEFGGENFAHSVHAVNKFITENVPDLQKALTSGGKKLPPNIMRQLNNVAKRLYSEAELVSGDKPNTVSKERSPEDYYSNYKKT